MHNFRQKSRKKSSKNKLADPKKFKFHELTNGPSKLCMAFDIRRENCDKIDLATSNEMWLEESDRKEDLVILTAKRIGIDNAPAKARDKLWRFYVENNLFVSSVKPSQIKKTSEASADEDE